MFGPAGPSLGLFCYFDILGDHFIFTDCCNLGYHYPVQISIHFYFFPHSFSWEDFPFSGSSKYLMIWVFMAKKCSSIQDFWCVAGLPLADASGLHHWQWQRPRPWPGWVTGRRAKVLGKVEVGEVLLQTGGSKCMSMCVLRVLWYYIIYIIMTK